MSKGILILGMHRSGTSLLSQIFKEAGSYIGENEDLLAPKKDNKNGFFERKDVMILNDRILKSKEATWINVYKLLFNNNVNIEDTKKVKKIILQLNKFNTWHIKDPRLCLNLSIWNESNKDNLLVFIQRDPVSIAKSLIKRNNTNLILALALNDFYNFKCLNDIRINKNKVIYCKYEDLLNSTDDVLKNFDEKFKQLNYDLNFNFTKEKVSKIIDKNLDHSKENIKFDKFELEILDKYKQKYLKYNCGEKYELLPETTITLNNFYNNNLSLQNKDRELFEKDKELVQKNEELVKKNKELVRKNKELIKKSEEINLKKNQINYILNSNSWKITKPLRFTRRFIKLIYKFLINKISYQEIKSELKNSLLANGIIDTNNRIIFFKKKSEKENYLPILNGEPKVSIIIVNHNGQKYLEKLLKSILEDDYKNLEIIIYDNDSKDFALNPKYLNLKEIKVIKSNKNIGFAEGSNEAYKIAKGELIFFLNNDTYLEDNCIYKLVDTITKDNQIAAVSPKILFYEDFFKLTIFPNKTGCIDLTKLNNFLEYKKFFIKGNNKQNNNSKILFTDKIELFLPESSLSQDKELEYFINNAINVKINNKVFDIATKLNKIKNEISFFKIINNAGSDFTKNFDCFDIGFGEIDKGQYDNTSDKNLLCGCAILLNRYALDINELPFNGNFFAYFEDSDFSMRLKKKGFKLSFNPYAVVRHYHASTFGEKSEFFKFYVKRNSNLFKYLYAPQKNKIKSKINEIIKSDNSTFKELVTNQNFSQSLEKLILQIDKKNFQQGHKISDKKILVMYNEYWDTLGGGELRALSLIKYFNNYQIYLVATKDFDMDKLKKRFNFKDINIKKYIFNSLDKLKNFSANIDLFINSTHDSSLRVYSKKSIYLVSFPSNNINYNNISKYDYIFANSKFTRDYVKSRWNINCDILYPEVNLNTENLLEKKIQEIKLLNVGRFFSNNHSKKQYEIICIFKKIMNKLEKKHGIKVSLHLVGGVDYKNKFSFEYFNKCIKETDKTQNINFYPNLDRNKLLKLYEESQIYLHFTGLGEHDPSNHEHFGISVVEAMQYCCLPLVFCGGGPAEIVSNNKLIFEDLNDFENKIENIINLILNNFDSYQRLKEDIFKTSREYKSNYNFLKEKGLI